MEALDTTHAFPGFCVLSRDARMGKTLWGRPARPLPGVSLSASDIASEATSSLSLAGRCPRAVRLALAALGEHQAHSIAAALQIFKMTTETAYDAKAYDQKMQDL